MIKRFVLGALLIFLFLPVLGFGFLLYSSKGLIIGFDLADRLIPGNLKVDDASGRLADHFILEGLRYTDGETAVIIDKLSLSWAPAALLRKALVISSVAISGMDVRVNEKPAPAESSNNLSGDLPALPPIFINIRQASLESVTIAVPGQSVPAEIDRIILEDLTGEGNLIRFGRAAVSAASYSVDAKGRIETGETISAAMSTGFSFSPEGYGFFEGEGSLSGTLAKINLSVLLHKPFSGTASGTIKNLFDQPVWQAVLQTDHVSLPDISSNWPQFDFSGFRAEGEGKAANYSVQVETDADYGSFKNIHLLTSITGDANALQFSDTLLRQIDGELSGAGRLNWEKNFTWAFSATGKQITLSNLDPDWPEMVLSGITANGWGEKDRYNLEVQADGQYKKIHGLVHVETSINGNADGLQLTDTFLNQDDAELVGEVQLDWRQFFRWNAAFEGRNLNPAVLKPELTGSLDARFLTAGKIDRGNLQGNIDLLSLEGNFREYPLTARGKVVFDGNNFTLDDLFLQTTGTELTASGQVAEDVDLQFQVDSSDLSVVWPELGGNIQADGFIRGKRRQPALALNILAEEVTGYGNRIGRLDGQIFADLAPDGTVDASVSTTRILAAERTIDSLKLDIGGTVAQHKLQIDAAGDDGIMVLQFVGGLVDKAWNGEIKQAEIDAGRFGSWQLGKQGGVTLSGSEFVLGDLCMAGTEDARFCLAGRYGKVDGWQVDSTISFLPLSFLWQAAGWDPLPTVQGTVSGNFVFAGSNAAILSGELNLSAENAAVQLSLSDDQIHELAWDDNVLHAVVAGNRLTARLDSSLRDGSTVTASLALDDVQHLFSMAMDKTALSGTVHIDMKELKALSALTSPIAEPAGRLIGDFTLGGTVGLPLIDGRAKLASGKMIIPDLGITLQDLDVLLEGDERLVKLYVSGKSGGGELQAEGGMALEAGKADSVRFTVRGNDFEAVHLPELRLAVAPQLDLRLSREGVELYGSVRVTDGIISPYSLAGTISPSKDVVFAKPEQKDIREKWPFSAELSIIVDKQVKVNAFGLKGRLAGEIKVVDLPGKIVTGTGNLDILEGTFAVYGRELQIKTGQLLYSGGPIDNPGISVRAENTTQNVTTGIAVSGFLREPEISFYSDPPMEQNEIISRLLMNTSLVSANGKASSFIGSVTAETGIAPLGSALGDVKEALRVDDVRVEAGRTSEDLSLVIGTWMTPRLYISYGKNLLKESGSFNTRYILGYGFSLETETGSTESGVDLKYEINK